MSIRFAHISDSHVGPARDFELYEVPPANRLERLVQRLNEHATELDFVVHTGDLVCEPDPRAFGLAREILQTLRPALYLVNGNHDDAEGLRRAFPWPPADGQICGPDGYCYTFRRGSQRFLVLDAVGPKQIDPQGWLSDAQLRTLDTCLETYAEPLTVFIHFPALALDCRWLDQQMLIVNGHDFHRRLVAAQARIRGVFFGHVHRGVQVLRDGVFYCSVGSTFCQFQNWPSHDRMLPDRVERASYNLVTLDEQQVTVRQMWA
jgi:3',5'-cyclic AMP phosphodiesterase CpdA